MKLQLTQSDLFTAPTDKPRQIVTETSADFFALCARADRGELVIEAVAVGQTNGQWIVNCGIDNSKDKQY